ncbi:MAG: AAA family ATPase [Ignavibacteriales bacterium]|nr:AAA family ATPase [Ignavibacteriales bacterium]
MNLIEIEIQTYRSIIDQKINMTTNCIGFIGLNESGKTNLLNAIRFLDPNFKGSLKDKSKINDELPYIRYVFNLNREEEEEIIQLARKAVEDLLGYPNESFIKRFKFNNYVIVKYISKEKEELKKNKSFVSNFELEIETGFQKPKEGATISPGILITIDDVQYDLATLKFIKKDLIPEEHIINYVDSTIDDFRKQISQSINQVLDRKTPSVVYWEYGKQYLLPSEITYDAFTKDDDPSSNSTPLYNIFMISDRLNIESESNLLAKIKEWKLDSSLRRRDSHILTEDINKYIKGIWKEYDQNLNIELEESKITIHINDPGSTIGNFYEMESRSQGFKTFISFILTTAAEMENNLISNSILVLDEPETHLHPSGVRFMRDELLKLSENNSIFYATHSIFMIDRRNLKRHIIVKKEKELTKLTPVDRNNIIQESVIYEALGTSVDEFSIRNKNIVFEGEMDLVLFQGYLEKCISKKDNVFSEYELLDSGGTRNIKTFFKDKIIPRESEWLLILDNDSPGRSLKTDIEKYNPTLKQNIKYHFYSEEEDCELEDLLPHDLLEECVKTTETKLKLTALHVVKISRDKNFNSNLEEYKAKNKIDKSAVKFDEVFKSELLQKIKEKIERIKESTFDKRREMFKEYFPVYEQFIDNILKKHKSSV